MSRLPLTIWGIFITSILHAVVVPVFIAIGSMHIVDGLVGTGVTGPGGGSAVETALLINGGRPTVWHHHFWLYARPAVYLMVLPVIGIASDVISCFARKPLFSYNSMVYAILGIAGLGCIIWTLYILDPATKPTLELASSTLTLLLAVPFALVLLGWYGTLRGGSIELTTPMLFMLAFVSMGIVGGLSGAFVAVTPVNALVRDTYFMVAHFHFVLFAATLAIVGAIYFWFPKMFGRRLNTTWGKVHFFLTFVLANATFFLMCIVGMAAFPRRAADPYQYAAFRNLQEINQWITIGAIGLVAVQIIFATNFLVSMLVGRRSRRNPWRANTLEWIASRLPGPDNFSSQPIVYRGPYEYGSAEAATACCPQHRPLSGE